MGDAEERLRASLVRYSVIAAGITAAGFVLIGIMASTSYDAAMGLIMGVVGFLALAGGLAMCVYVAVQWYRFEATRRGR